MAKLTELRATDLRFSHDEAAIFLNQLSGLNLEPRDVASLEARTEGWVAGLQLAALSILGQKGRASDFIQSFTGSHHFVVDYLLEEVLEQQPDYIQTFLLHTSILERMCGPLCDALLEQSDITAQEVLEHINSANLFLIPLDNERRWYRYHHLFRDLLRQRLKQTPTVAEQDVITLNQRAAAWYAEHGFEIEALQHAITARDTDRAIDIIESDESPLYFRGGAGMILSWLQTLETPELDARPMLWIIYAWVLWVSYQSSQVESKLQHVERVLQVTTITDDYIQDIVGNVAALRALLATNVYQAETIITESNLALELIRPTNLYVRIAVLRSLAAAYNIQGDRTEAIHTYGDVISMCEQTQNVYMNILASTGLTRIQESQLYLENAGTGLSSHPRNDWRCVAAGRVFGNTWLGTYPL